MPNTADEERFLKLVDRITCLERDEEYLEERVHDLEREVYHLQTQIDDLWDSKADR